MTPTQIAIAPTFVPILLERSARAIKITYKELLAQACERFPTNPYVQQAIPLHVGDILSVIRTFGKPRGYPDLTALAVNQQGEVGAPGTDGPKERNAISKHDWSKFQEEFDAWIVELGKVG